MVRDGRQNDAHRPLTILVNALSAVLGGGITVVTKLTHQIALDNPKHRLLLLCTHEEVSRFPYPENVEILERSDLLPRLPRWKWEQLELPALLEEREVDVVLGLGGYATFKSDVPQVAVWQNPNVFSPPGIPRPLSEKILVSGQRVAQFFSMRKAAQNVFLTANSIELASRYWNMDRVPHRVIRSGVDLDGYRPEDARPLADRDPVILSVGHTYSHKNYEAMVDAMAEYRKRFDHPIRLEIVGAPANPNYFADLEARIKKLGLDDCVSMLGPLPREEVLEKMSRARLYLVTSLLETFGLTLFEAMGLGLPVVASDATCHPEVGGDAVLYCDPRDPADIAAKIRQAFTDDELVESLREKGFARVQSFTWAKTADQYVDALETAAG